MDNKEQCRAEFEQWVITTGVFNDSGLTRSERSGEYHRAPLQLMYEAWQAALAASATTEPSDLSKAIMHIEIKPGQSADYIRGFNAAISAAAALASQPAAQEQDKIDAQRYRWLRDKARSVDWSRWWNPQAFTTHCRTTANEMDSAIDKAAAAQLAQSADTAEG